MVKTETTVAAFTSLLDEFSALSAQASIDAEAQAERDTLDRLTTEAHEAVFCNDFDRACAVTEAAYTSGLSDAHFEQIDAIFKVAIAEGTLTIF